MSDDGLVADVAHQVRTPLAVIRGYAELLGVRDDEATRLEAAAQIRAATDVLEFMVDDLLVVFALEAGVLPFEVELVDVAQATETAIDRLRPGFPGHTFVMSFEGARSVKADAEHVDRILTTLLLNACRLSPEGGGVVVAGRAEGDALIVSVSDSGAGLDEDELADIFERRGPSAAVERSEVRSTGLELYKVRRLVELHEGTVKAESRRGQGSTFSFALPR